MQISVKKSASLSIIFVSMNVGFGDEYNKASPKERLEIFNDRVGNDKYTKNVTPKDLTGDGLSCSLIRMFSLAIEEALMDINAGKKDENPLMCKQIACFKYADSQAPKLTIGWITYCKDELQKINDCKITELDFFNDKETPYDILVPPLTMKEVGVLNRNLPGIQMPVPGAEFLTEDEVERYARIYRYYPALTELSIVL